MKKFSLCSDQKTPWLCVLLVLFSILTSSCKKKPVVAVDPQSVIRLGEVLTLTGPEAGIGIAIHQGIEVAVREFNQKAGVLGRKIEIVSVDDQGRAEEAATAITQLITQSKVNAVLGASASSRSIAIAAIAQKYQIPMITPTSTHPKITEMGDFIFRVCFIDPYQGQVMADFASRHLKFKKVALLRDMKSDYSVGLAGYFVSTFQKNGGEIVADQSYSSGDVDFKSQLTALRAKSPQAIFVPGYYSDVALIARQAKELGIGVPLLGGDGWSSPKLTEIGGSAIEGSYFASHYASDSKIKNQKVLDFESAFKQSFGDMPNALSALGYDALGFLVNAIRESQSLAPQKLRQALAVTKDYSGVTGKISMDLQRNAQKSAVVLKVSQGRFVFESSVDH